MATKTLPTSPLDSTRVAGRRVLFSGGNLLRLAGIVLLLLLAGGGFYLYQQNQDAARRVPPAVQVAGVAVGGLTEAEASAAIAHHFAALPDTQVLVRFNEKVWTFTAHDLGIALDATGTAQAAHAAGRDVSTSMDIPLVLTRDRTVADQALQTMAADVAVAPQDAGFTVDADGVHVAGAQPGRRLDADATWQAIVAATQSFPFGDATAQVLAVPPKILDADIAPALATVHQLTDQPIVLTAHPAGDKPATWSFQPALLRTWLLQSTDAAGHAVVQKQLDPARVQAYLQDVATAIAQPAQDAVLALPNYATAANLTPDVAGRRLNMAATAAAVPTAALAAGDQRTFEVTLDAVPAAVPAAALQP